MYITDTGGHSVSVIKDAPAKDKSMTRLRDEKVAGYIKGLHESLLQAKKGKNAVWYPYEGVTPLEEYKCQVNRNYF